MSEPLIIAGFAGIGKTYLADKYQNVIDLESSPFHYDYTNVDPKDYEIKKGDSSRIVNKNFPQNYIEAIIDAKKKYDILLIWLQINDGFLELLEKNGINYQICLPSEKAFESYMERYKKRGNTENWLSKIGPYYEKCVKALEKDPHKKIILEPGETLESYLLNKGYELKLKV